MSTGDASDEAQLRSQVDALVEAIRAHDLEGVKPIYARDIVSFDIVPPLEHVGAEAQWRNWADVFEAYEAPLGYEVHELVLAIGGDVAFGHSLNRISGTLKTGRTTDMWLRWTTGWRKVGGRWVIAHHQASVPIDLERGRALVDLAP